MSAIKSKNTGPEVKFRKALRNIGIRGYRLHWKIIGKPDIAFPGKKIAIFIHGCYWHKCQICSLENPKSNSGFWSNKLEKNVERDQRKRFSLESAGWTVLIFWECQINKDMDSLIEQVIPHLKKA